MVGWETFEHKVAETVRPREEVRPMNAVSMWVLPLVVTVGRLT
jgi:hypothetical protein